MDTSRQKRRRSETVGISRQHSTRRSTGSNCTVCPVCTVSVRGDKEFKIHYRQELEKVNKVNNNLDSKKKFYKTRSCTRFDEEFEKENHVLEDLNLDEREVQLKNIKKRKFERYADMFLMSLNKKKNICTDKQGNNSGSSTCVDNSNQNSRYDLFSCAICNEFLESEDTAAKHLAKCFAKTEYEYELYSSSEDEDDGTVEEFSWAGQTWLRASSLLDTDYLRREGKLMRLEMDDGDEELDVDGDNNEVFGKQQYLFDAKIFVIISI